MTVFSKIKDENQIKSEADFESQMNFYLKQILNDNYVPKSIKIRFETKNAFITMVTQRDAEEFITKFQEYAKDNQTNLFFNLYKSKVERISANSYIKKYNHLNQERGVYKKYNQFGGNAGAEAAGMYYL